ARPMIQSSEPISSTGNFQLSWGLEQTKSYTNDLPIYLLEECNNTCKLLYQGHDTASVISGRPNGNYHFKISEQSQPNQFSEITVQVIHYDLQSGLWVLLVGFLLFVICILIIVFGEANHKKKLKARL
ncbi:MAG: hypothetical protein H3C43_06075, partial [Leptonema sp. (in: Bacteria)]|nr:hypothetical protein [Leptonema sp. (in: bacteria)]